MADQFQIIISSSAYMHMNKFLTWITQLVNSRDVQFLIMTLVVLLTFPIVSAGQVNTHSPLTESK